MMRLGLQTALHGLRQSRLLAIGTGNGTTTSFTQPPQVTPGTAIYVNDWQGNQLQYATPRTNLSYYSITPGTTGNWGIGGLTLSSATSVIPNGVAGKVTGNGTFSSFEPGPQITSYGKYTWSVIIENVSELTTLIGIYDTTASHGVSYYSYTWATQTIAFANGYASDHSAAVQQLGTGPNGGALIKFSVSGTPTAGNSVEGFLYPDSEYNTSNALIVHGAQLETGSVATSIIPTTTAAVTQTDYSLSGGNVVFAVAPPSGAAITATA